jgi:hypothetical protein
LLEVRLSLLAGRFFARLLMTGRRQDLRFLGVSRPPAVFFILHFEAGLAKLGIYAARNFEVNAHRAQLQLSNSGPDPI